jgi:dipeptidyl-peptidase-4
MPPVPSTTPHFTVAPLICLYALTLGPSAQLLSQAQTAAPHPSESFVQIAKDIDAGKYFPDYPAIPQWLDNGARYTLIEPAVPPAKGFDIVAYDAVTGGNRTVLVSSSSLVPKGANEPLALETYSWSPDHTKLLAFTNSKRVWRRNTRGDFWVLDRSAGTLTKLGGLTSPPSSLMFAKFSPDGRSVAYVRNNNLYVEDLSTHKIRTLTLDGSNDVINGTSDWVNEEELDIRDGFRWSPDSRSIAFWQFNQAGVQLWTLIDETSGPVPVTHTYHYPQAGTTNSATRIGVVNVDQPGKITWLKLPGDPREHYIPHMDWVPHTRQVAAEYLDRLQRDDRIYVADAGSGESHVIFQDTDPTYVDTNGFHGLDQDFTWLPVKDKHDAPPTALLWFSERDGWRHAYAVPLNPTASQPRLLTDFAADIIASVALDVAHNALFFTASPDDPLRAYLYRVTLDGSAPPKRLTPASETGTHDFFQPSPDGLYAFESFVTANTAPRLTLARLSDAASMRTIGEFPNVTARLASLETPIEFTDTPIDNHITLSTKIIKPPHFDPAKKYPVFTYVYGEPFAVTVVDGPEVQDLFLHLIAREGYVVVSFDNQGTPAPRGRAWRHAGYGSLGVLSTQQQAEAIRSFAASHPFVDTTRMAIWGWSGGGTNTLNMMFRNPGLYSTGIVNSPGPDQKRYDTIYQERYMGLPSTNAQGYHDGSAINFSAGLAGNLLIIHGSGDDNTHFAGTEELVNRLIAEGKTFDFMVYPGRTHSLSEGEGTLIHNYTLVARYLEDHVPAGPR